jgi:hypothetical protein
MKAAKNQLSKTTKGPKFTLALVFPVTTSNSAESLRPSPGMTVRQTGLTALQGGVAQCTEISVHPASTTRRLILLQDGSRPK